MYTINLAGFKRLTVAGGVALLIIAKIIQLNVETGSPMQMIAPGFFFGFISAFTICWIAITASATKVDQPESTLNSKTRDAE